MKDGLRFVDCDMHIMEPVDLFERYLDPRFKDRVTTTVGADGRPRRRPIVICGWPTTSAGKPAPYRNGRRPGVPHSTPTLSPYRLADTVPPDFPRNRQ